MGPARPVGSARPAGAAGQARLRTMGPVHFDVPAAAAYAYLADAGNRPAWQASLRRVAQVSADQRRWRDVTWVPGVSPAMVETLAEPPHRWAEAGTAGPFTAHLLLELTDESHERHEPAAGAFSTGGTGGTAGSGHPGHVGDSAGSATGSGCSVVAHYVVDGPLGLGRLLTQLAGPAIAADLRRAARLASGCR